jgi:hypothetical protein
MLDFSRLAHDLRWIAIDQLGLFKEPAKVTVRVETLDASLRTHSIRVRGPRAEPA